MNRKIKIMLCVMAAAALLLGAAVLAADAEPGSDGDPLISLSYLQQEFSEYMKNLFRQELDAKTETLRAELDEKISLLEEQQSDVIQKAERGSFRVVSLDAGKTLELGKGAELILRSGAVQCGDGLVLLDEVGGGSLLAKNRLYVVLENGTLTASETSALLVRQGVN